ncbi:Aldo/keto reductase [Punctularia strigosozonata HHB-11173 SS5]|uniref:Aldo/keto reductase n=1 Tax=Punctularia strigosozonata (strain HHB-11173) TaxID=741275 RepID=UPI0004417245|nr:Aldo/keto reductase [Punctularia strigosozonata HHB-11173 SS5]EIN07276.1 Aldo/keto reductase [Punctularia strigosozonata HHB-11173 SS5]
MAKTTFQLNDGTSIPWIAFGTGTALYNRDAENAVVQAISLGVTHLDGAQVYGNEDSLGSAIAKSGKKREELYVVTKVYKLQEGETVIDNLKGSLKRLKLDYVDLFLIHSADSFFGRQQEIWKGLEAAKEAGLTKSIGVSNYRVQDLEELLAGAKVVPAVNQIEFHPYVYKAALPIYEFDKKHGILTTSYGGLSPIVRHQGGPLDKVLPGIRERLSSAYGKPVSDGQVLTKWLLQKGVLPVTTSSKAERIKEFLDTINVPDLTDEEIKIIDDTGSAVHHRVFQKWMDQ